MFLYHAQSHYIITPVVCMFWLKHKPPIQLSCILSTVTCNHLLKVWKKFQFIFYMNKGLNDCVMWNLTSSLRIVGCRNFRVRSWTFQLECALKLDLRLGKFSQTSPVPTTKSKMIVLCINTMKVIICTSLSNFYLWRCCYVVTMHKIQWNTFLLTGIAIWEELVF